MRSTRPSHQAAKAFTLIEILVVVAIIALLVSILLPSLSLAKAQAKSVACQSNLRQLTLGLRMYQMDSRGFMPSNLWSEYDWSVLKKDLWFYKLDRKYVADPKVLICPADPFGGAFDYGASKFGQKHLNAAVPSCGYGMNYLLRHMGEPKSFNTDFYHPKRPENTILLAEVGPDDRLPSVPTGSNGGGQPWRDGGRIVWDDGARAWYSGPTWLTTRHYGGINVAAIDLSVKRANTARIFSEIRNPPDGGPKRIRAYYPECAAGGCMMCTDPVWKAINPTHYNFSASKLYWWTGPNPDYGR